MVLRYERLQWFPAVFKSMTGLQKTQFDDLVSDELPRFRAAEYARLGHPDRKRAIGAGPQFDLDPRNQLLLTVIWLRLYPIHEVLAYLIGISDSTVSRTIARVLPRLEDCGYRRECAGTEERHQNTGRVGADGTAAEGGGAIGDLAYVGIDTLHAQGLGAAARKKPRGKDRPPEDVAYNRAFWNRRVMVEDSIGRMRRYQSITQMDRNHWQHTARVQAVAGLVNRQRAWAAA